MVESIPFVEKIRDIIMVADRLPGVVIIHDVRNFSVIWMSRAGLEQLGATLEEVTGLSNEEYHRRYFNEEDAKDYVPKLRQLIDENDQNRVCTFFQQVRFKENADWSWHITGTRILEHGEDGKPLLTISMAASIDDMHQMTVKAERILEENNFLRRNSLNFSKLSKREKEILKFMALGKSTNEIADSLFISPSTVDTHRKNIRQKLEINSNYDITMYAQAFNIL